MNTPTAKHLAQVHAAAFTADRPWTEDEFASLQMQPGVFVFWAQDGFIMVRTVLDEAEILTLAVTPDQQGQGTGADLVRRAFDAARERGAVSMFLEVAADNHAALRLYKRQGFAETGRRRAYYPRPPHAAVDAVLMQAPLTTGHASE